MIVMNHIQYTSLKLYCSHKTSHLVLFFLYFISYLDNLTEIWRSTLSCSRTHTFLFFEIDIYEPLINDRLFLLNKYKKWRWKKKFFFERNLIEKVWKMSNHVSSLILWWFMTSLWWKKKEKGTEIVTSKVAFVAAT